MKEKGIQWLMGVSAVSCLVWGGGLIWTMQDYFTGTAAAPTAQAPAQEPAQQPAPSPAPESAAGAAEDGVFRVLALGDSLTRGTGDPEGKGYVGYALEAIKDKIEGDLLAENLGINGQTSPQLAESLGQAQVQAQVKTADIILLSIGGNDLFRGGETLGNLEPANIQGIQDDYAAQLDTILQGLRQYNPSARIFLIGLYNPFMELQNTETTTKVVRDWNYRAAEVAAKYPQTVLVPTFDLFQLKVQGYLAEDLFHPNAAGYRLIGDRVAALITD